MNWVKNNWFKIGILIILGFIVYIFYFRYTIDIPNRLNKVEISTSAAPSQELKDCLDEALLNYSDTIDMYTNHQSGITYLPARTQADTELKNDQDTCIKEYK